MCMMRLLHAPNVKLGTLIVIIIVMGIGDVGKLACAKVFPDDFYDFMVRISM